MTSLRNLCARQDVARKPSVSAGPLYFATTCRRRYALLDGAIDLAFLPDGDPTDGIRMSTVLREPHVAVLPSAHRLARRRTLHVKDLRNEPFILFARRMGPLAFDRTIVCCERNGFHPNIVQDAPPWPTLVRLVAAGLGVSLAPASVASVKLQGAVYREVHAACRTTIETAIRDGPVKAVVLNFMQVVEACLQKSPGGYLPDAAGAAAPLK